MDLPPELEPRLGLGTSLKLFPTLSVDNLLLSHLPGTTSKRASFNTSEHFPFHGLFQDGL